MTSHIGNWSRSADKTLLLIALLSSLFCKITRLDAQWSWNKVASGTVVFPSWGITTSGRIITFERDKKPLLKADVIKPVPPEYPDSERANGHQGAGFYRMIIDQKTGLVTRVLIETSTGFKALDDSVIKAGLQWRWKPATWKEFIFPCHFQNWAGYR
jgi:TonB family protein